MTNGIRRVVRNGKRSCLAAVLLLLLLTVTGCGGKSESWAYSHDPTVEILNLGENGKAVYKGEKYSKYVKDDEFITLSGKGGEIKIRYEMDKDNMILYEESTYTRSGDEGTSGVIGEWAQDNGWTYTFAANGQFVEDKFFGGYYSVNEENGTIKLMYSEPMPDAILYYSLEGDRLTIAYPWILVKTEKSEKTEKSN